MFFELLFVFFALSENVIATEFNGSLSISVNSRIKRQTEDKKCVLPPYPANGLYSVGGSVEAVPGDELAAAQLQITCRSGFKPRGSESIFCVDGVWSGDVPPCVRACRLEPHSSVIYRCLVTDDGIAGDRPCKDFEPSGTIVKPQCNTPNYFHQGTLSYMRCIEGRWNYVAVCQPDCGKITPVGTPQIIFGEQARYGEFPWHAGIYLKTSNPFRYVCGGSIISTTVIVTAAHCVWSKNRVRPPSEVAVIVGKLYRGWNNPLDDEEAQKFDALNIKVPDRYQHSSSNFQDDIAVISTSAAIVYKLHVKPICLDFDPVFDRHQLQDGNIGKVAGWGLTTPEGSPAAILQVLSLPYVPPQRCIEEAPEAFRTFITSDKICAGYLNGSAVCRGDSGGGLVFPETAHGIERYYLRGIVSTAPPSTEACNAFARTSFTHVYRHQAFVEENTILFDQSSVVYQQETTAICVLPLYPPHGRYEVVGTGGASPGQAFYVAQLNVACDDAHYADKQPTPACKYGVWNASMPDCIECGRGNIPGGSEQPWVAMIYANNTFKCGGVVVRPKVVLTGGLCVVERYLYQVQDPATYQVAVGKLYPKWDEPRDSQHVQKSGVSSFLVTGFRFTTDTKERSIGYSAYSQIAALELVNTLTYTAFVQPICMDLILDRNLFEKEISKGVAKSVSFIKKADGYTTDGYPVDPTFNEDLPLSNIELTNLNISVCRDEVGAVIISIYDRIHSQTCHKTEGDKGSCKYDFGFPVVYPKTTRNGLRYYLRAFILNNFIANPTCAKGKPLFTTPVNSYTSAYLDTLGLFW